MNHPSSGSPPETRLCRSTPLFGGQMGGNPSRIPGIVVQPVTGVVVHPRLQGGVTLECPVSLRQVAPTILKALALSPQSLDAVRLEGTKKLPDDPTCD